MKKNLHAWVALLLAAALLCGLLSGCGSKKLEAGDYTGSFSIHYPLETDTGSGSELVEDWGANVTISIDEDGVIWNIVAEAPEGATMAPQAMAWTVYGGKFTGSITGNYTCAQIMEITVDVDEDGFPVTNGDCSGIHLPEGVDITLLNDHEIPCAMIILAMQDAITTNGLA